MQVFALESEMSLHRGTDLGFRHQANAFVQLGFGSQIARTMDLMPVNTHGVANRSSLNQFVYGSLARFPVLICRRRVIWRLCAHHERTPGFRSGSKLGRRGFAPAPTGFSALLPLPMGPLLASEMGMPKHPHFDRSSPLSRRSGCFPAWPYPPLRSG